MGGDFSDAAKDTVLEQCKSHTEAFLRNYKVLSITSNLQLWGIRDVLMVVASQITFGQC